jgi:tetratricopeptide (TPR) repeat protein
VRAFRLTFTMAVLFAAMVSAVVARADDADRMRQLLSEARGLLLVSELTGLIHHSPGVERAASLWTDIGSAQAKIGDQKAARESFDHAWEIGAAVKDHFHRVWTALRETAQQQASAGQVREAIEHARGFAPAHDRWSLFLVIASAQEIQKDFAGSRKTVAAMPAAAAETQADIPPFVVETYANEQNFSAALAACDRIDVDLQLANRIYAKTNGSLIGLKRAERTTLKLAGSRRSSVTLIVAALNQAGRFDEALRVAGRLKADGSWQHCVRDIVKAAAAAGRVALAEKCFRELTAQYCKDDAAPSLVAALANIGRFREASELTDRIQDRNRKAQALFELAVAYAARGDEPSFQREYYRLTAFDREGTWPRKRRIVAGFVRGGHIAKAASFAEKLEKEIQQAKAGTSALDGALQETRWEALSEIYQGIGSAAARAGRHDVATQVFDRSRAAERHDSTDRFQLRRLSQLAIAEADVGLSASAMECLGSAFDIAGQLDLSEGDVDDVIQFAATQVALGQREFAQKTLSLAIKSLSHHPVDDAVTRSLQSVAQAQAWVGDVDDAIRAARAQSTTIARASMDVGIVQGMLARREGKVLLEKSDPLRESGL